MINKHCGGNIAGGLGVAINGARCNRCWLAVLKEAPATEIALAKDRGWSKPDGTKIETKVTTEPETAPRGRFLLPPS